MTPSPTSFGHRLTPWLSTLGAGPHAIDDVLSWFNPLWTLHRQHARVVARHTETPAAITLVLQVPRHWPRPQAGEFMQVGVTLDGVHHSRAYSLRAVNQAADQVAITVQHQPGGLVSGHLHAKVREGDILTVRAPTGDFVLPSPLPPQLLMLAGGSGITPFMAMLEQLQRERAGTRVTLVYFARSTGERIFARALSELARQWPLLDLVNIDTHAHTEGPHERTHGTVLTAELLDHHAPGWVQQTALCCGPAPMMDAARQLWEERGIGARLTLEAFAPRRATGGHQTVYRVTLRRDHRTLPFAAPADRSVLLAGEQAGLSLPHGCRQGVCHECTCRLESGSIVDLRTGQVTEGHGDLIQLCVSAPLSDLSLHSS